MAQILLERQDWDRVLGLLARQSTPDMLYRYSPTLLKHASQETIQLWMRFSNLNSRLLLPAMLNYEMARIGHQDSPNFVVAYLEHCIDKLGTRDQILHNYLLHLYVAEMEMGGNRQKITKFLKSQVSNPIIFTNLSLMTLTLT